MHGTGLRRYALLVALALPVSSEAQGLPAVAEGAAWGFFVTGLPAGIGSRYLACRTLEWEKCPTAFQVGLLGVTAGGIYLGAAEKDRLPSVRRGALTGMLVAMPVSAVVMWATKDAWSGSAVEILGAAVGAVVGALTSQPADDPEQAALPMLVLQFRW